MEKPPVKTTVKTARTVAKIPKTYAGLMAVHMVRPIHDQVDAENAAEMLDLLAGHKLNAEQSDYLDLLSDLYEKWENAQFPIHRARGPELLRLALAARGESARHLATLLRIDVSLAYRLVRGERRLTAAQISRLAEHYSLDPSALLP